MYDKFHKLAIFATIKEDPVVFSAVYPALANEQSSCTVFSNDDHNHQSAITYIGDQVTLGDCVGFPQAAVLQAWLHIAGPIFQEHTAPHGSPWVARPQTCCPITGCSPWAAPPAWDYFCWSSPWAMHLSGLIHCCTVGFSMFACGDRLYVVPVCCRGTVRSTMGLS